MITYLVDTSALWHLFRTPGALRPWEGHIAAGVFHLCEPTRAEFLYSATSPSHRDELAEELDALCLLAPVPKNAWRHRSADVATMAGVLKGVQQRDVRVGRNLPVFWRVHVAC
ncbi:PIN domain-containing protein [Streptomyces sp. NPDC050508]|uniref:PIN domain-containing protein n=1 Tax=Streptomyces sp. NPDC050508 TaxID=3155405 RepID=UPI00342C92AC